MENAKTVELLTETPLAVIACANETVLQDFLKFLSIEYGKPIEECAVDEIDKINPMDSEIVIVRGIRNCHGKQKLQTAQKLTAIKDIAKVHNAHFIVPLEQIDCEPHLVTAQLRGMLLRTPEDEWREINMFNLRCNNDGLKLECEFGPNAGWYIIYDYNASDGQVEEKR
ncbi:MAG: hypothetical protein K2J01_00085 [Clostridiales bacterium]|nr:hypothetical protein [Clostridiales bacterium]